MSDVVIADPTLGDDAEGEGGAAEPFMPDVMDPTDKYSMLNMVGGQFKQMMMSLPPELADLTEVELRALCKPTTTDYSLRASFWREYEDAVRLGRDKITNRAIFGGVCHESYWLNKVQKSPIKVAWIIRPVQSYKKEMEAILTRGTQRLWELVDMDVNDKNGQIDVRRAELLLKIIQEVGNRVKGMSIQRVQKDQRSVRISARMPQRVSSAVPQQSLSELRQRLSQLETQKHGKALPARTQDQVQDVAFEDRTVSVQRDEAEREIITVGVVRPKREDPGDP